MFRPRQIFCENWPTDKKWSPSIAPIKRDGKALMNYRGNQRVELFTLAETIPQGLYFTDNLYKNLFDIGGEERAWTWSRGRKTVSGRTSTCFCLCAVQGFRLVLQINFQHRAFIHSFQWMPIICLACLVCSSMNAWPDQPKTQAVPWWKGGLHVWPGGHYH